MLYPEYLSINCLVFGDNPKEMSTIEIPRAKNVSILKEIIKEKNSNLFSNFDSKQLDLWKSSAPLADLTSSNLRTLGPALKPHTVLNDLFSSPLNPQNLHIIARPPQLGTCHFELSSTSLTYPFSVSSRIPSVLVFQAHHAKI